MRIIRVLDNEHRHRDGHRSRGWQSVLHHDLGAYFTPGPVITVHRSGASRKKKKTETVLQITTSNIIILLPCNNRRGSYPQSCDYTRVCVCISSRTSV